MFVLAGIIGVYRLTTERSAEGTACPTLDSGSFCNLESPKIYDAGGRLTDASYPACAFSRFVLAEIAQLSWSLIRQGYRGPAGRFRLVSAS